MLGLLLIILAVIGIILGLIIIVDYVVNAKMQGFFQGCKLWFEEMIEHFLDENK